MDYVVDLHDVNLASVAEVGGKNASTGELIQQLSPKGMLVPGGFATTASAYREFLQQYQLDQKISVLLKNLKISNIHALNKTSAAIRQLILHIPFIPAFEKAVAQAYAQLNRPTVAVRSSATAEDLPSASFAGQQETFLNIKGLPQVLSAIKLVYASLFTSRAIAYRHHHHFDQHKIAISVGIQPMIRSDKGASGVIFTLDTETGFDKVILITATHGLGETIVQGRVNPDEFLVYKPLLAQQKPSILQRKLGDKKVKMVYASSNNPKKTTKIIKATEQERQQFCLTDKEVMQLAQAALMIEQHYQKPMDIEWAKDGITGKFYILQARPETVKSRQSDAHIILQYALKKPGKILVEGQSIGQRIGAGRAHVVMDPKHIGKFKAGEVLVTDMTDPDWEPVMKQAAAIVTNRGGRTCHAAIVARELGIPALVGCVNATTKIKSSDGITVSCAEGQVGVVYAGILPFSVKKIAIDQMPSLPIKLCLNMGNPDKAFAAALLPNHGVGLARLEFIISNRIGLHPNAALNVKSLPAKLKKEVLTKTAAYKNPVEYYIEKLREGISMIAAAFDPKPVIFRFSDFKSNEYANLLGGELFEPLEENPMIGFRGAARYKNERFKAAFELECLAFKRVRNEMGLLNAHMMIPFVRTVNELHEIMVLLKEFGLSRGEQGLQIYMMCEVPSNAVLVDEFLAEVDGYSIGSNDLTQLVLGLDRDSNIVADLFDERNAAVKALISQAIRACRQQGKYVGICGQGPSDHPDFAAWLLSQGIQSISLNSDTIVATWLSLAKECTRNNSYT